MWAGTWRLGVLGRQQQGLPPCQPEGESQISKQEAFTTVDTVSLLGMLSQEDPRAGESDVPKFISVLNVGVMVAK